MTRISPLEKLRTWLDAPWIYLGYGVMTSAWMIYVEDYNEIREQLFAEFMGWA